MKASRTDPEFTLNAAALDTAGESGWRLAHPKRSSAASIALIAAFVLVLVGVAAYFVWQREHAHSGRKCAGPGGLRLDARGTSGASHRAPH